MILFKKKKVYLSSNDYKTSLPLSNTHRYDLWQTTSFTNFLTTDVHHTTLKQPTSVNFGAVGGGGGNHFRTRKSASFPFSRVVVCSWLKPFYPTQATLQQSGCGMYSCSKVCCIHSRHNPAQVWISRVRKSHFEYVPLTVGFAGNWSQGDDLIRNISN